MRNPSSSTSATVSKTTPCCSKVGLKRGPWTPEEDELLSSYIKREGEGRWRTLPKRAGLLRCGKSCRLRWMNYLRPSVKRGQIAPDEEDLILRLHRLLGNRWSLIAGRIPGRTDNEIKNYWNTHLSKKLISQGIDPRTHKPLNPNPNSNPPPPPNHNPNPNPNPNSSVSEEVGGCRVANLTSNMNAGIQCLVGGNLDRIGVVDEGLMMGHGNTTEDGDMDYCTDEIFSSFLNNLMNEDMFLPQQQHLHQSLIVPADPQVPSAPSFSYGAFWEAAVLSPEGLKNQDECRRFADADATGKRF